MNWVWSCSLFIDVLATMSYVSVIESNIHVLLRCTNINVMIIACLAADDALSEDQVSQITAMPSSREQCKILYDWMKTSFQLYESFLNVMQTNDQIHVSNLLTGVNDGTIVFLRSSVKLIIRKKVENFSTDTRDR